MHLQNGNICEHPTDQSSQFRAGTVIRNLDPPVLIGRRGNALVLVRAVRGLRGVKCRRSLPGTFGAGHHCERAFLRLFMCPLHSEDMLEAF